MSAPTTQLESTTALVKFEAKLHRLWVAHHSTVERDCDRRRVAPLPQLPLADRLTCGQRIVPKDAEIGAYLARVEGKRQY